MSRDAKRERTERMREDATVAIDLARSTSTYQPQYAQSIALSLGTLVGQMVDEQEDDRDAESDRDRAFAAELRYLATGPGRSLPPLVRTEALTVLAEYLGTGYDEPPTDNDYRQNGVEMPDRTAVE